MPEEIQGQEEQVQEETQETTQEQETLEELSNSEQPTEESQEEAQELPEDAKERTRKEFEKLKQHNAELKRQLDDKDKQQIPSVLDFLDTPVPPVYQQPVYQQPVYRQPTQQQPQEPQLMDDQGYLNADVLRSELNQAKIARQKAEEAERRALEAEQRMSRFEINSEQEKLYQAYPELDPQSDVFNQDAYDLVKNELTSQLVNTGKRNAIQAASKMSKYFRTQPQQQVKTQQVLEQRRQASVPGTTQVRPSNSASLDDLKLRSRNDPNAVNERLRRLGM